MPQKKLAAKTYLTPTPAGLSASMNAKSVQAQDYTAPRIYQQIDKFKKYGNQADLFRRKMLRRQRGTLTLFGQKFTGQTETQAAYKDPTKVAPPLGYLPRVYQMHEKLKGLTKKSVGRGKLEDPYLSSKAVKVYEPPVKPKSTYKGDFVGPQDITRPKSVRPERIMPHERGDVKKVSTYRRDYIPPPEDLVRVRAFHSPDREWYERHKNKRGKTYLTSRRDNGQDEKNYKKYVSIPVSALLEFKNRTEDEQPDLSKRDGPTKREPIGSKGKAYDPKSQAEQAKEKKAKFPNFPVFVVKNY